MNRNNLMQVIVRLLSALALVILLVAPGMAQPVGKTNPAEKSEQDSVKQARRAAAKAVEEARSSTGWLILDGKLIPGPYDVTVTDSSVMVNSIVVISPRPRPENLTDEQVSKTFQQLEREYYEGFDSVRVETGAVAARIWAYEFMQNHPGVATADSSSPADLADSCDCEELVEEYIPRPQEENTLTQEELAEKFKRHLQSYGKKLKENLSHGGLVIERSGGRLGRVIPYPKSKSVMDELIRIDAMTQDVGKRAMAMQEIIGYNFETFLIALRFKTEKSGAGK